MLVDFHKVPHQDNFTFVERVRRNEAHAGRAKLTLSLEDFGDDVFRLEVHEARWPKHLSQAHLSPSRGGASRYALDFDAHGAIRLAPRDGKDGSKKRSRSPGAALLGRAGGSFGVCGNGWVLSLVQHEGDRFFGMGEKWGPLEKSGIRTKFYNTDVWADFPVQAIAEARIDPAYASVPYLIVAREGVYFGILVDDPYPVFMATNPRVELEAQSLSPGLSPTEDALNIGASDGRPVLYFLVGPTLDELTQKLQRLCGTTPRPPLWALGHHQSRWGYAGARDLEELDEHFEEHDIPCDGLWLDIDYMDAFKVFTLDSRHLPDVEGSLFRLQERGRRVVPILDPGVKVLPGYTVYEQGLAGDHFCLTAEGKPYTGFVWPGRCHFPDFSKKRTRAWWAGHVSALAARGFDGFWIDMNDPSVGPVELGAMRFDRGRESHESYHNQYALGMAEATRQGLVDARPTARPFVLTRSAFIGMSRYAAVWTGDNLSNYAHLRATIPVSINLALSGIPFNGPDVPGFGGDATDELCVRWYETCFLFPFFRNHSTRGSRRQEPWAFSQETLEHVRHYVRLRYWLLPYLYQLFVEQERSGTAILRPTFFEAEAPGSAVREDQFFVGPSLLQAPVLEPAPTADATEVVSRKATDAEHDAISVRSVELPSGEWFCARSGKWVDGAEAFDVNVPLGETPLYLRRGALLPTLAALPRRQRIDLGSIELHAFVRLRDKASLVYELDDGESLAYQRGALRRYHIDVECERRTLAVSVREEGGKRAEKLAPLRVRVVAYGDFDAVRTPSGERLPFEPHRVRWTGDELEVLRSPAFTLG